MNTSKRVLTDRDLAYNDLASNWTQVTSTYDTRRRVQVLVHDFLGERNIRGASVLDGGAGYGDFTEAVLTYFPRKIVSIDIAPDLVEHLKQRSPKAEARVGDLLNLESTLHDEQFDVVLSSDVIEHTPDPKRAVHNLMRTVKKGGLLSISCPNSRWLWLLYLAQAIGMRPHFQGYENWVRPKDLISWIKEGGFDVLNAEGLHSIPWHVLPNSLLRAIDLRLRRINYPWALNLAVLARKRG